MAAHDEVTYATATGNDYPAHEQTYETFTAMVKYGTISLVVLLGLMAFFLV